jgi:hypothetical protein
MDFNISLILSFIYLTMQTLTDEGRWECDNLEHNKSFIPTEENAKKIETWNSTRGHMPFSCRRGKFFLAQCAVNCYTTWFSGACPELNIPKGVQYLQAKTSLLRYNFIAIVEKLRDPKYVSAVESFFGVEMPRLRHRYWAYCQKKSHIANQKNPLKIENSTLNKLTELNEGDIKLYKEITDCFDGDGDQRYISLNGMQRNSARFDHFMKTGQDIHKRRE